MVPFFVLLKFLLYLCGMEKILYCVRGIPGSGKSTFAKTLGGQHYEADMFFINENGEYNFDFTKIKDAHQWCQGMVKTDMRLEYPKIVVSNTSTQEWEMEPYFNLAKEFGYSVFSVIVENVHGGKNIHNVPDDRIKQMKERFVIRL
jgi:predicted kinase